MKMKYAGLFLAVLLLLIPVASCKSSPATTAKVEPAAAAAEEDAGSRFVIDQKTTQAFTPITITPTTVTPTTITKTTITPTTVTPTTITPTTMTPTTITQTTITPSVIQSARDLVGTWKGSGISFWLDGSNGQRVARTNWEVILIITEQVDNAVKGTLTMNVLKQEALVPQVFPEINYGPTAINKGKVVGATLTFNDGGWDWTFTFTTDLMNGEYTAPGPGDACDPKAFSLTRQK
ncbi:MAG: hypothetical protein PHE50_01790 [Dehalococcoidales bacterium]|nr:hypothetical protein [Dehalococcoidales bacterium]